MEYNWAAGKRDDRGEIKQSLQKYEWQREDEQKMAIQSFS